MRESIEITFGDKCWTIRPVTLGQVQAIELLVANPPQTGHSVASALKVLSIALKRDYPSDISGLDEIEGTVDEVQAAMSAILALAGFVPVTEFIPQGEAQAPAAGAGSEAA
jgi:hypothetical protein